jgi:spore coat polysaccharide biosynthesis protein SpsF
MTHLHTVAIIQARMGARRLPGKVLLDIGGQPMLARVVERTQRAKTVDQVIVATTTEPDDDAVAAFCTDRSYPYYRGSLHDVLDRYYRAAYQFNAGVIVRITADCPAIDPEVVDRTVNAFWGQTESIDQILVIGSQGLDTGRKNEPRSFKQEEISAQQSGIHTTPDLNSYDFVANRLPPPWIRTYPIGLDTEVCSFHALEQTWNEATHPHQREHVMPYMYEHCDRFRVLLVNHRPDYGSMRWTVDTHEDLELLRKIYAYFDNKDNFSWLDILELLKQYPELTHLNANVRHKTYNEVDERGLN